MAPAQPYLEGDERLRFDRWLEATWKRFCPPLTFAEIRKGAQALSTHYVERRGEPGLSERALAGRGKRAAFATYYAALHFLAAWHVARRLEKALADAPRVHDLGCGTGAAGAAVARALGAPAVRGVDRSGWALGEARRTYAAFGLHATTSRARLPGGLPRRTGPGDLLLLAWTANELGESHLDALAEGLWRAAEAGARVLVLEPLAGAGVPWWDAWAQRARAAGGGALQWKRALARPALVARMDKAAGLDHAVLGARALWLPGGGCALEERRRRASAGHPRRRPPGRGSSGRRGESGVPALRSPEARAAPSRQRLGFPSCPLQPPSSARAEGAS